MEKYPKPGPIGGKLIRETIAFLRNQKQQLPLSSDILIAISGGSDSVGLAHLIIKYGRRIVPQNQIRLLHVNHQWRGRHSDADEEFVINLGKKWDVPVIIKRLKPPSLDSGRSWEEDAREKRKRVFAQEAEKLGAVVFTAHQADDLAETLLWRLLTGAARTHGGGIGFQHGVEIRPFLKIRKSTIRDFLKEEGQVFREDWTNLSERFLRARMRRSLMPEIERIFPRAIDHLVKIALDAQKDLYREQRVSDSRVKDEKTPYESLFRAAGVRIRRSHQEQILEKWVARNGKNGEIHLPGGWRLTRELARNHGRNHDRWVLELL